MSLGLNHAKEIGKKEAWDFLMNHHRFLLVGHEHPDGDDVGSICALHNVLVQLGKEADILLPDPCPRCTALSKPLPLCIRKCRRGRITMPWCLRIWEIWSAAGISISPM